MATTYRVITRDVDGGGKRTYKTLAGALARFEEMAGFSVKAAYVEMTGNAAPDEREIERVRGVSMYGTVVVFERIGPAEPTPLVEAAPVDVVARIAELEEAIEGAEECHADTVAQHRSESAMFGDSWPGARLQIEEARNAIEAMKAELRTLFETPEGVALTAQRAAARAAEAAAINAEMLAKYGQDYLDNCPF
jgi:hypothetical protein